MSQDINIVVILDKQKPEDPKLLLTNNPDDFKHKIVASLTSECEKCCHNLNFIIHWQVNTLRNTEIKEEGEFLTFEPPVEAYHDTGVTEMEEEKSVVSHPEVPYPLPTGLTLPSLKSIQAPYFNSIEQPDGSYVYIEKKTKNKGGLRVTNYDPRCLECDLCNFEVENPDKMSSHRKFHFFPKNSEDNCRGCGFFCSNSNEKQQHTYFCPKKQTINGLVCIECDYEASDFDKLRDHLSRTHSGFTSAIKRSDKEMSFKSGKQRKNLIQKYLSQLDLPENLILPDLNSLKCSYSRTHSQPDGTIVYIGKRDNNLQIMNFDPTSEKCELCGKSHLKNKENVINHRIKMHFFPPFAGDVCQGCQREFRNDDAKKIHSHFCTKKHLIKVNYCNHCKEQFSNYPNFASHLKKFHDGEGIDRKFMCHLCSRSFEHEPQLAEHVIRHADPKPFKCAHCDSEQRNKKGIITHLIRFHFPTAAKFSCDSCNPPMLFAYEKQFQCHIDALHLRLQKVSVPCPTCGKLIRKKGMKNHIQKQHTDTFIPKETFECQTCHKTFFRRQNLAAHQLMHLPEDQRLYKCSFCDKTFNKKLGFIEHERSHTGEKPYKCEHCGKAFARSSTFQDHKREHTGQRFVCSVCGKEYKDRGNYRHHMKQHESQMGVKLTFNHEERRLMKLKVLTAEQALKSGI